MKIIAKSQDGFLLEATESEINQILNAVLGKDEKRSPGIGTKLPAVDYAATITKIKGLKDSYDIKTAIQYTTNVLKELEKLNNSLEVKID